MVKVMAICVADAHYAARLADYVNQKGQFPFTAMAFSGCETLLAYARDHPVEILMADEKELAQLEAVKAVQVIALCEGRLVEERGAAAPVYKYQSGDAIMREVMASYSCRAAAPALAFVGQRALVMGVYSPIDDAMKAALALTMGQVLARRTAVLYLSLQEYSGFSRLISDEGDSDLSEVFYLYRQGELNWLRLKTMVCSWNGMDFIPPVRYGEDLNQMPAKEMAMLLGTAALGGGYERIVVDLGNMGRGDLALLDACDVIYMPVKEDCVSAARLEEFDAYLEAADDGHVREKIERLQLPLLQGGGRRGTYAEALPWGALGDYVRRLLGELNGGGSRNEDGA